MARNWLNADERVVLEVRPHWSWMARPLAITVLVLAAAVGALIETSSSLLDDVLAGLAGLALLWLVVRYARWATTLMILTSERLVQRRGVLARRVRELPLVQIGEVQCRRRVRDRALGTGDLVVVSVSRGREVFEHLPRPVAISRELHRQMELARGFGSGLSERVQRLEELHRRGTISRADLEAEKARLRGTW